MQKRDFLIIGQGLAGSLLAWELLQRGRSVMVVDNGAINASTVAAGLVNPVTGKRLTKSDHTDQLLESAKTFYARLELYLGERFYMKRTMLRVLRDEEELQAAEARLAQPDYKPYLDKIDSSFPGLSRARGVLRQKQTGYLRTAALLARLKDYLRQQDCLATIDFDHAELKPEPGGTALWNEQAFQHVIFCEGYKLQDNPYFNWLPLQPVKGEMLTLKQTDRENTAISNQHILNYGRWLIPLGNHTYRTGATFVHDVIDQATTTQAREQLMQAAMDTVPDLKDAVVTDQQAGVRPATPDREPMIGRHEQHPQLLVFNGFGTKGSLKIPFYCQRLADHLLKKTPIPAHASIQRFNGA